MLNKDLLYGQKYLPVPNDQPGFNQDVEAILVILLLDYVAGLLQNKVALKSYGY